MAHYYWNALYFGGGWVLWCGFVFRMLSSFGNWGYTYRAHQKYSGWRDNRAFDILDERYARGEINRNQYVELKSDIGDASPAAVAGVASSRPVEGAMPNAFDKGRVKAPAE